MGLQRRLPHGIWLLAVASFTVGALAFALAGGSNHAAVAMPVCPSQPAILLDPGHGGIDGGANVPGLLEKDVVLDVALRTRRHLAQAGVPVVMTRTDDRDLGGPNNLGRLRRDLNYRVRVANHCKVLLMLSLHVNSAGNPQEHGIMVFHQASRPSRDAAYLFDDILRRWQLHQRREAPIVRTDFAVLKTRSPAVLIELGFVTNASDRERLADEAYREKIAQGLAAVCTRIFQKWSEHGVR